MIVPVIRQCAHINHEPAFHPTPDPSPSRGGELCRDHLVVAHNRSQRGKHLQHHSVHVLHDVTIREAQDMEAVMMKVSVAHRICRPVRGFLILDAIDFDDQSLTKAGKIDNEIIDRRLTAKVITLPTKLSQFVPKDLFSKGGPIAKPARNMVGHRAFS